ncbi:PHP domain-containing protein, partial [Chloroflexota bacterium]
MHEIVINLHIHTRYSDGNLNHAEICQAAADCGLDAIITTDHNILVQGINRYYEFGDKNVLLLTGEEIHDQSREPQKNHLLVLG